MAAGLNPKKKRSDGKPSTVLIIFLVFFILISIGLGVTAYYGYAGQEKLKQDAKTAENKHKSEKVKTELFEFVMEDLRRSLGVDDKSKLAEEVIYQDALKTFVDDNGKWKGEAIRDAYKQVRDTLLTKELGFNDAAGKYTKSYQIEMRNALKEVVDARSMLQAKTDELKAANDKFDTLQSKQDANYKSQLAEIVKGNQQTLAAAKSRTKELLLAIERNTALENQLQEAVNKFEEEKTKLLARVDQLGKEKDKILALQAEDANGGGSRGRLDVPHALLLDISRGKTLWDRPLGKITRVENQDRQVYINIGSAHGVKPEVTFTVFAAGQGNRPEKELKGTIEVLRVLDGNTSLARITSLYDTEGLEILLTDPTKGRAQRESDNALKDGDLLFNMLWGARVAIAGNVHFAGQQSDNPAEQMRILASFVSYLERMGMRIDAYIDLTDGKIRGPGISSRTRYLIRGSDIGASLAMGGGNGAPKKKMDKDADGAEKKDDEPKKDEELKNDDLPVEGPDAERLKNYKDSLLILRSETLDKGLFVISVDNLLNVAGYRSPRSANDLESLGFRPSVISAGQGLRALTIEQQQAEPKKDEEPKEKEVEAKDM